MKSARVWGYNPGLFLIPNQIPMKKLSISLLALFIALSLSACSKKTEQETTAPETKTEAVSQDPVVETATSFESAKTDLDIAKCQNIENKEERTYCEEIVTVEIMRNAVEQNDASLCKKISDSAKRTECEGNLKKS